MAVKNSVHELTALKGDGTPLVGRIIAIGPMDRDEKRDRILSLLGPGAIVVDYNTDNGREIRWTA